MNMSLRKILIGAVVSAAAVLSGCNGRFALVEAEWGGKTLQRKSYADNHAQPKQIVDQVREPVDASYDAAESGFDRAYSNRNK